jgi:hypothetical protein
MKCFGKALETLVKIFSSCIVSFKISVIMIFIFDVHFRRKLIMTKLTTKNSFISLLCGFQANKKRGKLPPEQ